MAPKTAKSAKITHEQTGQTAPELSDRIWAVVSFERIEGSDLTYVEAVAKMRLLEAQGGSGLCIITSQAAGRMKR